MKKFHLSASSMIKLRTSMNRRKANRNYASYRRNKIIGSENTSNTTWNGKSGLVIQWIKIILFLKKNTIFHLCKFNVSITVITLSPSCITNVEGSTMQRFSLNVIKQVSKLI